MTIEQSPAVAGKETNLKKWFSSVQVVNLDKFPARWKGFHERAKKAGITGFERFPGIEGDKTPHPPWWRAGNGAWGCMSSHFHIAQRHLTNGNKGHLLLFEDDCVFSEDFAERLPKIMEEVGDDWDMLYFGGQHQHLQFNKLPWRNADNKEVINAHNLCRTHAFAVNKRFVGHYQSYIIDAFKYHKQDGQKIDKWTHFDHHLGRLHQRRQKKILAVQPWICGQAEGQSWTTGARVRENWWTIKEGQIKKK